MFSVIFINNLMAQSAALSFTNPTIIGNKFRVSLHVASVGGAFGMGGNNLTFNYSAASLTNPVIISTVFAAPTFSSVTTTGSSLGIMRINAVYSSIAPPNTNAVPITAAGMEVAIIEFNYNPAASTSLSWRITGTQPTTVIIDDDKVTTRIVSNFSNNINLSAGIDKTVRCDSDSTTLIVGGGVPPYMWSNGASSVTIKVKPSSTTAYTVTDSNGKKDTVNVIFSSDVYASDDVTLNCAVTSATLTAKCGGGNSYLWSNGATTASINVSPTVTTTYRVTATNGSSDEVVVTVNKTPPNASAGPDKTINCNLSIVVLNASGGVKYLWSNGLTTSQITVSPTIATTYYVTITDKNGCWAQDEVFVAIDKIAPPVPNAGSDVTVNCANYTTILQGTSNCSNCNFEWTCVSSLNDVTINANNASVTITTTNDNIARFKVTNPNNGCYSLDYVNIHVDKTEPDITISNDITIDCNAPQPITLTATTNGINLIWSNGSTNNSIIVNPTTSTAYSVSVTNINNGCVATKNVVAVCANTPNYIKVAMKVYLSSLDINTLLMSNALTTSGNFPLSDPYSVSGVFNNNFSHVNNPTVATISQNALNLTGADAIVDWLFIEIRKGTTSKPIVRTIAALLQADGEVVATDGISPLQIDNVSFNNYYIVVRHRNHLFFRNLYPILLTSNVTTLNFTNNSIPLNGIYDSSYTPIVMIGGDANSDSSIDAFDTIDWEIQNGSFGNYFLNTDYNMDGSVDAFDSITWEINNGLFQY